VLPPLVLFTGSLILLNSNLSSRSMLQLYLDSRSTGAAIWKSVANENYPKTYEMRTTESRSRPLSPERENEELEAVVRLKERIDSID